MTRKSAASARGLTDVAIRNLFILPTIAFLIIFNIFPLIYSLGYSFYDYSAAGNAPPVFVGLRNYKDLLDSPYIWSNFSITAKYVLVSVGGQVIVGFGIAVLLNRAIPSKGLITTLLLLPMMSRRLSSVCSGSCCTVRHGDPSTISSALAIFPGCPIPL